MFEIYLMEYRYPVIYTVVAFHKNGNITQNPTGNYSYFCL
jgi:hypothetical protein